MKVADLLNSWQATQCLRKVEFVFDMARDVELNSRRLLGKAASEAREAEARERQSVSLSGR
jgi:hypothetical protein